MKKVIVDEDFSEMMVSAVRYALGRKTYIVSDTVRYIIPLLICLSDKAICCMERDIREGFATNNVGDVCDATEWDKLVQKLRIEIGKRGLDLWQ